MSRSTNDWAGQAVSQGRYLVRTQLGEGGMGFVYRALDRNLDADVVIKVPRRALLEDPEFAARFAREVRSLVKLAHPNIVKVTDVGEHDGVPFAVMQYLSGGSLEDYAAGDRAGAAFPTRLAALGDWLPGIAAALDFVHSQGYVHRDVKPGNILFDAHGHVFLSDFGVAKALASRTEAPARRGNTAVTGAGMVLGTPEYMAPELIMGESFDGRIDLYALAVTVYEMLGGRRPFEAPSPTACMVLQTTQEPPPLRQIEPRVPQELSDAVGRALAKDPNRRFPTCASFASAVASALSGAGDAGASALTPSGRTARPDQIKLRCPACEKSLVFPAALLADPQKSRGKRLACPSCQTHLRVSDDGGSLVLSGPGTPTGLQSRPAATPRPQATRQVVAPRSATVPVSRPPVAQTVRQAPPPPRTPTVAVPVPHAEPAAVPTRKSPPTVAVVGGLAGALAVLAMIATVVVLTRPSAPLTGQVLVDASIVPPGATFTLDGRPIAPPAPGKPLILKAGPHELAVTGENFEPFTRRFPVSAGSESGFKVILTRETAPAPNPPPKAEKAKEALASRDQEVKPPSNPPPPRPPAPAPSTLLANSMAPNVFKKVHESRVERTPSSPSRFKPVPEGPPVEKESLATLLQKPETLADRVVVPTGLYVLGPIVLGQSDVPATTTVTKVLLQVRNKNLAHLSRADSQATVQVDPDLANNLRELKDLRVSRTQNEVVGIWTDTACVLTFHVQKRTDSGEGWTPILTRVEFLVGMNFARVGDGNFKNAFTTINVDSTTRPHKTLSDRHDWSTRLGVPYRLQLKHFFQAIKDIKTTQVMQALDRAMAPALGSLIESNQRAAQQLSERVRLGR